MKRCLLAVLVLLALVLCGCAPSAEPTPVPTAAPAPTPSPTPTLPENPYEAAFFRMEEGFMVYDGDFCLVGVDVSAHQKEIDWQAVAAAGVDFAMIRVGYRGYTNGSMYEDKYFRRNMEGALEAGLKVGVYFFSQATDSREAMEEAAFVLERIRDYDVTFPVVFDWERQRSAGSRTAYTSGETQTDCAVAFCRLVEQAGYLPMVYASPNKAYGELDLSRLTEWPFWLAHYTAEGEPTGYRYHYDMWQYTCHGRVDGISTEVDLDLCLTDFSRRESPAQ